MTQRSGNARSQYLSRGWGSRRGETMLPGTESRGFSPESWEHGGRPPQQLPHPGDTTGRERGRLGLPWPSFLLGLLYTEPSKRPPGTEVWETQSTDSGSGNTYRWKAELKDKSGEAVEFCGTHLVPSVFYTVYHVRSHNPVLLASSLSCSKDMENETGRAT